MPKLRKAEWAAAVALTLLVAALHLVRLLHAGGLWRDEAAAVRLATLPTMREVYGSFQHEAFPLVFPVAIRTWVAAGGGSDAGLRLFGLLVGLALIVVLWRNARSVGSTLPLVSLTLLGFNVPFLVYGNSMRGYGLGSLLILLFFGLLAQMVERPSPGRIAAAAGVAILAVHCLLHNLFLVLGLCAAAAVVGLLRRTWSTVGSAAGIAALAGLSLLPYRSQLASAGEWNLLVRFPVGPKEIFGRLNRTAGDPLPALAWVWLLLAVLGLVAVWRDKELERRDVLRFCALTIPAALLVQYAFLQYLRYAPRPWYWLASLALVASALDVLLARRPDLRALRLGAALLLPLLLIVPVLRQAKVRMTNIDLLADHIEASAAPEDLVLVNPWYFGVSFQRYYSGKTPWMTLPDLADHRFHRYDLFKSRMMEPDPIRNVLEAVERTLRAGRQVWLVGGVSVPPPGQPPLTLPPAPNSRYGWMDVPYRDAWSQQLGAFLRDHALQGSVVEIPTGNPVSPLEDVPLITARGWRAGPVFRAAPGAP